MPNLSEITVCAFPRCDQMGINDWPVCGFHAAEIAYSFRHEFDDLAPKARTILDARVERNQLAEHRAAKRKTPGQIYYIRLNDVIKIGWTSNLHGRLIDYNPGAVLLAHHQGTRADERDLHRSFAPLRVHGREWYRGDAQIILDHIATMLEQHGQPTVKLDLNKPKGQATHVRHRAKSY